MPDSIKHYAERNYYTPFSYDQDKQTAIYLGGALADAEARYKLIAQNPNTNPGELTAAGQEVTDKAMMLQAFSELLKTLNQLKQQIIQKLGLS